MVRNDVQSALKEALSSELFTVGHTPPGHEVFNSTVPVRVGASVQVQTVGHIQSAMRAAAAAGRKVSVLTSGHGLTDGLFGDVTLNLSSFDAVSVDAENHIATIGGGARWSGVIDQCNEVGLAPLSGSSPGVGAVGYMTGGGMGLLAREFGFCADHVVDVELVTGSGEVLTASPDENADLFWAIRGSQSSVGVVTAMRVKLFPVERFYGGNLIWPAQWALEVVPQILEWVRGVPESMSVSFALIDFPPVEALPELMRGRKMLVARLCTTSQSPGDQALMADLAARTKPVANTLRAMPLSETATIHADPLVRGNYRSWSYGLREVGDSSLRTIEDWVETDSGAGLIEFRLMGGAVGRRPAVENCVDGRDFPVNCFVVGEGHPGGAEETDMGLSNITMGLWDDRAEHLLINFMGGNQLNDIRSAFRAESINRLAGVIDAYDPDGVMRTVIDVRPHAESGLSC